MIRSLTLLALLTIASPALAQGRPLEGGDVPAFSLRLGEMGFKPGVMQPLGNGSLGTTIMVDGDPMQIVFSECEGFETCDYLTLSATFSEIVNPPAAFVARENVRIDPIKVWVDQQQHLGFSATAVVQGWSEINFITWTRLISASRRQLMRDVIEAGLHKPGK
ncbi:MAG: hypothetical protein KF730_14575 [Sphingomonas sp.]|uniref:hypothetical protein n=1 Tax=Sphingomonas sp. TaxID=28214 RepID=UPI0025FD7E12|nr:hypothetical protein [Sphingomonas sp.]MBX3565792.1 hypothetical protein [Sphingomonas sp.]